MASFLPDVPRKRRFVPAWGSAGGARYRSAPDEPWKSGLCPVYESAEVYGVAFVRCAAGSGRVALRQDRARRHTCPPGVPQNRCSVSQKNVRPVSGKTALRATEKRKKTANGKTRLAKYVGLCYDRHADMILSYFIKKTKSARRERQQRNPGAAKFALCRPLFRGTGTPV